MRRPAAAALLSSLFLLGLGGACGSFATSASEGDEDGDPSPPNLDDVSCFEDFDCQLVATNCCECPTFATSADFGRSCDEIECPADPECAPATAICDANVCTLSCTPVVTTQVCEQGFLTDEAGCTLDMCAPGLDAAECVDDIECVVVPADCCGCELGGNDTAVPAAQEDEHLASLGCEDPVSCPGVSTCESGGQAACLGGQCRYLTGAGIGALSLCGTTETGSCPTGFNCVLNPADAEGVPGGVGVCQPE